MYIQPLTEIDAGLGSWAEKVAPTNVVKAKLERYLGDKVAREYFRTNRSIEDDKSEDARLLGFYGVVVTRGIHMARMGTITESTVRATHIELTAQAKAADVSPGPNDELFTAGVCFYLQHLLGGTAKAEKWVEEFDMFHSHQLI